MITWKDCSIEFVRDGGLRDIVVSNTSLTDWESAYQFLLGIDGAAYDYDHELRAAPNSVGEIFAGGEGHRSMVSVAPSGLSINVHFFDEDEIEAVFGPEDVASQATLDVLLHFVQGLGDAVGKPVSVFPEGSRDSPIFTYVPESKTMTYHAPRFGDAYVERRFRGYGPVLMSWILRKFRK